MTLIYRECHRSMSFEDVKRAAIEHKIKATTSLSDILFNIDESDGKDKKVSEIFCFAHNYNSINIGQNSKFDSFDISFASPLRVGDSIEGHVKRDSIPYEGSYDLFNAYNGYLTSVIMYSEGNVAYIANIPYDIKKIKPDATSFKLIFHCTAIMDEKNSPSKPVIMSTTSINLSGLDPDRKTGTFETTTESEVLLDKLKTAIEDSVKKEYQTKEMILRKITVQIITKPGMNIPYAFAGKFDIKFESNKLIISPPSTINCVWTSIAICNKYRKGKDQDIDFSILKDKGKSLKQKCLKYGYNKDGDKTEGDYVAIAKFIANRFGITVNIDDQIDNPSINPDTASHNSSSEQIHLLVRNNHCCAVIQNPTEDQIKIAKEAYDKYLKGNYAYRFVRKPVPSKASIEKFRNIWTIDIETYEKRYLSDIMIGLSTVYTDEKYESLKMVKFDESDGSERSRSDALRTRSSSLRKAITHKYKVEVKECPKTHEKYIYVELFGDNTGFLMIKLFALLPSVFDNAVFYAHNGGRFDNALILKKYLLESKDEKVTIDKSIHNNGRWMLINAKVKNTSVTFKDSYCLLPGTLSSLTKDFGVSFIKKSNPTIDKVMTEGKKDNYYTYYDTITEYLCYDCIGLLQVINELNKRVIETIEESVHKFVSASSLALRTQLLKYYDSKKFPIFSMGSKIDSDIRKGYYGGRCECFYMGEFTGESIFYYDITSMYPWCGTLNLPYGEPEKVDYKGISIDQYIKKSNSYKHGFYNCEIKVKDDNVPKICAFPYLDEKSMRLLFPNIKNYTKFPAVYSQVIRDSIVRKHYDIKVYDGYEFRAAPHMREFYQSGFILKAKAKSEGKKALETVFKSNINSNYGRQGENPKKKRSLKILGNTDADKRIKEQYILSDSFNEICEYPSGCMVKYAVDTFNTHKGSIAVASAITSYARLRLWHIMLDICEAGYKAIYCDTDSVITTLNMDDPKNSVFKKKYLWDGVGKELGTFKNEIDRFEIKANDYDYSISIDGEIKTTISEITSFMGIMPDNVIESGEIPISLYYKGQYLYFGDKFHVRIKYSDKGDLIGITLHNIYDNITDTPCVNNLVVAGCKSYSYAFKSKNGIILKQTSKLKGCRIKSKILTTVSENRDLEEDTPTFNNLLKQDPDKFEDLGYEMFSANLNITKKDAGIYQYQTQFRCSDQFMLDKGENHAVQIGEVLKCFKPCYTKGKLEAIPSVKSYLRVVPPDI